MSRPDFATMARAWLVRAQGHASPSNEQSLAAELERLWELGVSQAVEAVHASVARNEHDENTAGLEAADDIIRALLEKPSDPRAS